MKVTEKVIYTLIEAQFHMPRGSVTDSMLIENVMKDSMDVMEFVAILSNEYDLHVDPENMQTVKTIGELVGGLLKRK